MQSTSSVTPAASQVQARTVSVNIQAIWSKLSCKTGFVQQEQHQHQQQLLLPGRVAFVNMDNDFDSGTGAATWLGTAASAGTLACLGLSLSPPGPVP